MRSPVTRRVAAALALAFVWTLGPLYAQGSAAPKTSSEPSVAGRWSLDVDGGPHGAVTMGLSLEQTGTKVSGAFESPHGDAAVAGEFANGALKLATVDGSEVDVTFSATLKSDGSLVGYLSSAMGDMTWTAKRVKDPK